MIKLKKASPKYFNSIEAWTIYNYVGHSKISASDLNKKYPTIIKDGYIYLEADEGYQHFITSDEQSFITRDNKYMSVIKGGN